VQGEVRLAILIHGAKERFHPKVTVEVMSRDRAVAERFLDELRREMRRRSDRGRVVSLKTEDSSTVRVQFQSLPNIDRGSIILPDGLLDRIERHTIAFARHTQKLRSAGRHLKRGILLHGVPGTGKTLTAMYLLQRMAERTVVLLTGVDMRLFGKSCALARLLVPSIVVIEDIDLLAQARGNAPSPMLMELLNEIEGVGDDASAV
jgi:hypothetical protein